MKCFMIMPFTTTFDPVFEVVGRAAAGAVPGTRVECVWLKDVHAAGMITHDIIAGLNEATFCIADVSGNNPNVMWETGYAMALGKPTILIGQDLASLPFDLASHRVLAYDPDAIQELGPRLAKAIQDTLARYDLRAQTTTLPPRQGTATRTITVTGTRQASEAAASRRVVDLLGPLLGDSARWLVGSVGVVDLAATRFLLAHGEEVCVVGYNRFDCARELRQQIEARAITFTDASVEALPRGISGAAPREVLFCTKSDLIVLLWDGLSPGTEHMRRFFQQQGVSTLLAFI